MNIDYRKLKKFSIHLVDLNSNSKAEKRKVEPVVIIQTDLLNNLHPSVIICPITTDICLDSDILRVHLGSKENGLERPSDVVVDQIRSIDKQHVIEEIGVLSTEQAEKLLGSLEILLLK